MKKIGRLCASAANTLKENGVRTFVEKTGIYLSIKADALRKRQEGRIGKTAKDILFIRGQQLKEADLQQLNIQMETLTAAGLTNDCISYEDLSYGLLKRYRVFMISGCMYTDNINKFIKAAKRWNKTIVYTLFSTIDQRLLKMCDGVIVSTEYQAEQLEAVRDEITAAEYHQGSGTPIRSAAAFGNYIRGLRKPNLVFVLPSVQISGGILVVLKHLIMLQKAGYDVTVYNMKQEEDDIKKDGRILPVLSMKKTKFCMEIDKAAASMWTTCDVVQEMQKDNKIEHLYYLVQGFEPDLYEEGSSLKARANATYFLPSAVNYITISKWCQKWLEQDYQRKVRYAPNGIDRKKFYAKERKFEGKIRILIEGDCGSYYKNVDESFEIVKKLDKNRYEIYYMSYLAKPKPWYHVDKFLHKIPYEKVPEVYRECHILLKSSILESFSYPPLEMMATGGFVVAVPNGGNAEYLKHGENVLLYEQGDIDAAAAAIEKICMDEKLRGRLYLGGMQTAQERDWQRMEKEILDLYK